MDKLTKYRQIVRDLINDYAKRWPSDKSEGETEAVVDSQRDHYELISVGWRGQERIHGCVLHIDIQDGKIWIQHDGIEGGVAKRLVESGVPKSDIVLAFHSPFKRKFTEYAVG